MTDAAPLTAKQRIELALFKICERLPPVPCSAAGAAIGRHFGPSFDAKADQNIRSVIAHVCASMSDSEKEAVRRRAWANVGRTFGEFAVLRQLTRRVELVGEENILEVTPDPRPIMLIFPHLANWEVMGAVAARHPEVVATKSIMAVFARVNDPVRMAIAQERRAYLNVKFSEQGLDVWRSVMKHLREPHSVVWAPVDGADGFGRLFPLFGRPPDHRCAIGKLIRIAAEAGARLLPMYCVRKPGARFQVVTLPQMELPHGRITWEETEAQIRRLNDIFEPLIRDRIDDWYMGFETDMNPPTAPVS